MLYVIFTFGQLIYSQIYMCVCVYTKNIIKRWYKRKRINEKSWQYCDWIITKMSLIFSEFVVFCVFVGLLMWYFSSQYWFYQKIKKIPTIPGLPLVGSGLEIIGSAESMEFFKESISLKNYFYILIILNCTQLSIKCLYFLSVFCHFISKTLRTNCY